VPARFVTGCRTALAVPVGALRPRRRSCVHEPDLRVNDVGFRGRATDLQSPAHLWCESTLAKAFGRPLPRSCLQSGAVTPTSARPANPAVSSSERSCRCVQLWFNSATSVLSLPSGAARSPSSSTTTGPRREMPVKDGAWLRVVVGRLLAAAFAGETSTTCGRHRGPAEPAEPAGRERRARPRVGPADSGLRRQT